MIGNEKDAREAFSGRWPVQAVQPGKEYEGEKKGVVYGGLLGVLEGLAIFLVPGIGEIAILGPLVGLLVGGSLGAMFGWIAGEANGEEVIERWRERLKNGQMLLVITVPIEQEEYVREKVNATHPHDVDRLKGEGWRAA